MQLATAVLPEHRKLARSIGSFHQGLLTATFHSYLMKQQTWNTFIFFLEINIRIMASNTSIKVPLNNLGPDHLHYFIQAFKRIILTSTTRYVLAQIIHGKPVREVTYDYTYRYPMSEDSSGPPPESINAARAFSDSLRIEMHDIDSNVCLPTCLSPTSPHYKLYLLLIISSSPNPTKIPLYSRGNSNYDCWR